MFELAYGACWGYFYVSGLSDGGGGSGAGGSGAGVGAISIGTLPICGSTVGVKSIGIRPLLCSDGVVSMGSRPFVASLSLPPVRGFCESFAICSHVFGYEHHEKNDSCYQ